MTQTVPEASSRKDPKTSAGDKLLYIVIKYKNLLIGALVFIVLVGAGTAFWMKYRQAQEEETSLQLSKITPFFDRGEYRKAIDGTGSVPGLRTIATKNGGTPSGKMASLLLANAYYWLGMPDSALAVYSDLTMKSPDLAAAVLAGTGACHAEKSEFAKAASAYEEAAMKAKNATLKAHYLASAADNYLDGGKREKAVKLYKKTIAEYPGSTGAALSQRSLWQISGRR